ncbi:MAG: type VII secretion integral membrane protein EccD [Mycolicibacterium sp.]|uniref:type VII secretion integral membrane protein EccD n=1 Tax=Mycolicibacterium sp. TaxID=2320850 RepID=UPI003D09FF09
MSDSLIRVTVHPSESAGTDSRDPVDLTLPSDYPVGAIIPPIVDAVLETPVSTRLPSRWLLTRLGGEPLDASLTLRQNDVHDGQPILLTTDEISPPRRRPGDSSRVVAAAANRDTPASLPVAVPVVGVVASTSAVVLAWTGAATGAAIQLCGAAALSAGSAAAAVVLGRPPDRIPAALSVSAVLFGTVAGFLAEPNAGWAPALLLAAAPGFAVAILLCHLTRSEHAVLTSLAVLTGATAMTAAIGVALNLPFRAAGAILTAISLVVLSAAPKLAVVAAGLAPSQPEVGYRRALLGHRVLTGLVTGSSSSAALGVVAVAAATVPGGLAPTPAAIFATNVGVLLLLRLRTHCDSRRRIALAGSGLCALAAGYIVAGTSAPEHAPWFCAAAVAAGGTAVILETRGYAPNPVVRQCFQILEYLALAAVLPLTAWITGGYGLVRELSLG